MTKPTVRDCAVAVWSAIERHGDDRNALLAAIQKPVGILLQRGDLQDLGIHRQGNNVAFSRYLYYDGELSILLFEVPKDKPIPPHDHGVWEGFCVYRGSVRHVVYQREDDISVAGYAELGVVQDEVMKAGEITIVAPPADIHGFTALEENTLGITIVHGAYKDDRHYYRPDNNSYVIKKPANPR